LIGAAGYVAPRHLKAIHDTGNQLVAALDPSDSVGVLDRYFPEALFFTEPERFERFLEMRRHSSVGDPVEYVGICSPNYLHDAHIRMALRSRADVICEKPIVINPWNMDALGEIEQETGRRVYTVLQLRLHPALVELKRSLESDPNRQRVDVCLTYVTQRGPWYDISWKGSPEKSGGVAMNIGVHLFDLCLWLFGPMHESFVHLSSPRRMAGALELEWASVRWFLSIERDDVPEEYLQKEQTAYRSMTIGGEEVEFSSGFTDLHTEVYRRALSGQGLGIEDARPSIELVYAIRQDEVVAPDENAHPHLAR
jgi:UDP-N-acetyl-2-amino-2-deoxyglucuronate dehydrogenase